MAREMRAAVLLLLAAAIVSGNRLSQSISAGGVIVDWPVADAGQDCTLKEVLDVTTATDPTALVVSYFTSHPECGNCLVGCASKTGDDAVACGVGCATPPKPPDPPTRAPAAPVYVTAQTEYGPVRGQEVGDVPPAVFGDGSAPHRCRLTGGRRCCVPRRALRRSPHRQSPMEASRAP